MAAVTNILWLNPDSIPENIAPGDTVTAPGDWTFTQNVDIHGSLTVTGTITSGATLNSVSHDAFIDLGFGYLFNTDNQPGGFTLDTRLAAGFTPGQVTNFPTLTSFVYTDTGGCTPFVAGDVVMLTNLPPAFLGNEGYYIVQAVSSPAFPQTVTIYGTSQPSTPWANTAFTAVGAVVPPGNAAKINLSIVAVADGTAQFSDADGNPWPVGTVLSAYVTNATLSAFQAPGAYNSIGNTSLQRAYDNGNTISTDGGLPIAFTVSDGNFTVDGTGLVDVNVGTSVSLNAPTLTLGSATTTDMTLALADNQSSVFTVAQGANTYIDVSTTNGAETLDLGAAAVVVNVGSSALARAVTVGSVTGTSSTLIQSGTGNLTLDTDGIGQIRVGNAGSGDVQIASSVSTRTVSIGAGTGTQALTFGAGSGIKTVTVGSITGTSATTVQSGTGLMTFTAGDGYDVNAVGAITIDSSTSTIGIGTDAVNQAINLGTAGNRVFSVGHFGNTATVNLNGGTGGITISTDAVAGNIQVTNTSTGVLDLFNDTGTGAVNIVGAGATSTRTVNIATGGTAAKTLTLGSTASTSSSTLTSGTGNTTINSAGNTILNAAGTVFVDQNLMFRNKYAGTGVLANVALTAYEVLTIESSTNPTLTTEPRVKKANASAVDISERRFFGIASSAIGAGSPGYAVTLPGLCVPVLFDPAGVPTASTQNGDPVFVSIVDGRATMTAPVTPGYSVMQIGQLVSAAAVAVDTYSVYLMPQFIGRVPA